MQTLWTNAPLTDAAAMQLAHELVVRGVTLVKRLDAATIAFGQPEVEALRAASSVRWVQLSSAGYTRYDDQEFRDAMHARETVFTSSSSVFADACAQHVLALMLAGARQLPASFVTQATTHAWPQRARRVASRRLTGQSVLLLGFGAIGQRLTALLGPFAVELTAFRRTPRGDANAHSNVREIDATMLDASLAHADHVVDLLPESASTIAFINAARLALFKRGACFYNIGRGATVDQPALIAALQSGALGAAFLDVMTPEPLPPEHPLWTTPNCYLTPHTAGGHSDESERVVAHFLANLDAFSDGKTPLLDRIF